LIIGALALVAFWPAIGSPPAPVAKFLGKFAGNCIIVAVGALRNVFLVGHVAAGFLRTHFCPFVLGFVDFHCCRIVENELSEDSLSAGEPEIYNRPLERRNQFSAVQADVSLLADTPDTDANGVKPPTVGEFAEVIFSDWNQRM
jgi:hypothetical protein